MSHLTNYILDGKNPVPCEDLMEWAKLFNSTKNRTVAITENDDVTVSTVFLGIDHNFCSHGEPILFETMVFGGKKDGDCIRYRTWEEAEQGHRDECRMVFGGPGF